MSILPLFISNIKLTTVLKSFRLRRNFSTLKQPDKRICIVGSGPAGFYAAQYILKHLPNTKVDLIERLPVPFGLVRFGVAPDHPEVKNVINTFTKVAETNSSTFQFYGNLSLGKDITLKELRERYHVVLLTYGAEKDRKLNIPNENDNENVISAREFVAWYNGLPGYENLKLNLQSTKTVSIIGQGNVAIDVARILLTPIDKLKSTDITEYALETLLRSEVERIYLIGRRGPLQAAFTIKELREMLKLPNVITKWRKTDFECCTNEILSSLQRPRKRITELMLSSLKSQQKTSGGSVQKEFLPIFMRSPKLIDGKKLELIINQVIDDKAIPTNEIETIETDMILRSIGYKGVKIDDDLNFDESKGCVRNLNGRVLKKNNTNKDIDDGLYVAGWLETGPLGVILTTMNGAFAVANTICEDFKSNRVQSSEINKPGLDDYKQNKRVVTWEGWKRIDQYEIEAGKKYGKPREKLVDIEEMLRIAGV